MNEIFTLDEKAREKKQRVYVIREVMRMQDVDGKLLNDIVSV